MNNTEQPQKTVVKPAQKYAFKTHYPLILGAILLTGGGLAIGYSVGHKQGLTVVGFDADAQELSEIVNKQKTSLDTVSVALNTATQERDVAVDSAKELQTSLDQMRNEKDLAQSLSNTYQDKLRERGGLSLTIQNMAIRPLPNNAFEYVLDLVQVSPNKRRTAGKLEIRLIQNDQVLVVPLSSANYNFESYERLTGRWTMPNGFTPQFIEVHLTGSGDAVIQRFAWQRGKQQTETPAFISDIPQTQAKAK